MARANPDWYRVFDSSDRLLSRRFLIPSQRACKRLERAGFKLRKIKHYMLGV